MTYEVGSRYPKPGDAVFVVQKKDYDSGKLTEGVVKDVLTSKKFHPRGHKVRLTSGIIGRIQRFSDDPDREKEVKPEIAKTLENEKFLPSEDDLV